MNLKRFFAKDMRTALQEIKEELGSDAIIMSSKNVSGGVEIVAAVETKPENKPIQSSKDDVTAEREIADDSVNISIDKSKIPSHNNNTDKKLTENKRRQEQFADSLAALLARQNKQNGSDSENKMNSSGKSNDRTPPSIGAGNSFKDFLERRKNDIEMASKGQKIEENSASNAGLANLSKEVEAIRQLLLFQLAGLMHDEKSRDEPVRAMIARLLVLSGFSEDVAEHLTSRVNGDSSLTMAWQEMARILENNLSSGQDAILNNGGAVALIGPTGVGKTTTLAKLAARFALKYGPDQVALISTDNYRIGASEQLQTYGRIMGCAVRVVDDLSTLSEVLYQLRNRSLVLIDTAGMGQRDTRLEQELLELDKNARIKLQHYLVLPGTAQRRVLEDTWGRFSKTGISGVILTKLDESMSIGDALSVCIEHDLSIAYTTSGQRVPEDIEAGDPKRLVQMLLTQIESSEPDLGLRTPAHDGASWARDLKMGSQE